MFSTSSLLRVRKPHEHNKVAFVELFFDLVFVFAITQLSHGLIAHFSALGAVETAMLLLAVWWVWVYTSWVTNWLDPEKIPVRLLLMILMLAGLVMSAALPRAFDDRGLLFAAAYVFMQLGRTAFTIWATARHDRPLCRNFQRILVWFSLSGLLWLAGGLVEGQARLLCWALALALEYASAALGFWTPGLGRSTTQDWQVDGGHMAERAALFIIIALGESILVTGATFSGLAWSADIVLAFLVSFAGSLAMWWLYFDTSAEVGSRTIAHSSDPGRLGRLVYTYIHVLIVAGIVVIAVADEFVLAHPSGHVEAKVLCTAIGGSVLYLLGCLLFRRAVLGRWQGGMVVALLALLLLIPLSAWLEPWSLSAATTVILVLCAVWEWHRRKACMPELDFGE